MRVIEPDPQSLVHQLTINGGPASRRGGRITLLEPQRLPGLRADLRIAEPGTCEEEPGVVVSQWESKLADTDFP